MGVQYFLATINGSDDETVHLFAEVVAPAVKLAQTCQPAGERK